MAIIKELDELSYTESRQVQQTSSGGNDDLIDLLENVFIEEGHHPK